MEHSDKVLRYEVYFTGCSFPRILEVNKGESITKIAKEHRIRQNKGVPKSERIKLIKIVRLN